jgi:hypothetical protein
MQYNVYGQPVRSRGADIGSKYDNGVYIQPAERVMQGAGLFPSSLAMHNSVSVTTPDICLLTPRDCRPAILRTSAQQSVGHASQPQLGGAFAMAQQKLRVRAGARIKVMRCAGVGPVVPFSYAGRRAFDAGIGLNLDLNGAGLAPSVRCCPSAPSLCHFHLQQSVVEDLRKRIIMVSPPLLWWCAGPLCTPRNQAGMGVQMRLRVLEVVRLHVLPRSVFKLKHAFPIFNTGLALHAAYYQPLDNLGRMRSLGRSGAQVLVVVLHAGMAGA